MTLPQLPREPIRPDLEGIEKDRELSSPRWKCFCCHDTGLVNLNLVKLVVPNYDKSRDKLVVCQNRRCEAGIDYKHDSNYDQRFTIGVCAELDKISRDDWRNTTLDQLEQIKDRINGIANARSLRRGKRTGLEEAQVQRRHKEILNADPEALRAMVRAYLGDEWMEEGSM